MSTGKNSTLPVDSVLHHIVDVHCHPTDAVSIPPESMDNLKITICAMSSRQSDQPLVRALATSYPEKVIPCFGYHPWFSHFISLNSGVAKEDHYRSLFPVDALSESPVLPTLLPYLPEPIPLTSIIEELRKNLSAFPNAMLGEVGLDRVFRVPYDYFASPRQLTPFVVPIEHQIVVLEAQLALAVELRRNVSLHSVKAQLDTKDLLNRMKTQHGDAWSAISVDLHSCGLSAEMWRDIQKIHNNVFLSLSTVINSRSPNHIALIKACSDDRILVESDYNNVDMCTSQTWDILQVVSETKGWKVEESWENDLDAASWGAIRKLENNWIRFSAGNHPMPEPRISKKQKRLQDTASHI